jgi:hypothetical protein
MNSAALTQTPIRTPHVAHAALPQQGTVVCSWCGQAVGRKPVSGARLSHTICRPCTQQFLAQAEQERNRRWI